MGKQKTDRFEDFQALIERTDKENPDPRDLKLMERHLDENLALVNANDISQHAFAKAVESCATSALMKEIYQRKIEENRHGLGYQMASPIERMLIDQVVLCWFRLNSLEMIHASRTFESHSAEHGLYWDKRLNAAQRRFIKACETLTKVQKCIAEAELRIMQARAKRSHGAVLATKLLKDLTTD